MDPYGLVFPVLLLDSPQFVMFFLRVKPGKYTCPMDPMGLRLDCSQDSENYTWRIIPVSKWLVTPIDMPFRPFITRPILLRGLNYCNHGYLPFTKLDDPPSRGSYFQWQQDSSRAQVATLTEGVVPWWDVIAGCCVGV